MCVQIQDALQKALFKRPCLLNRAKVKLGGLVLLMELHLVLKQHQNGLFISKEAQAQAHLVQL